MRMKPEFYCELFTSSFLNKKIEAELTTHLYLK